MSHLKHITAQTWVLLIVVGLIALPLYFDYSGFVATSLAFLGAEIWEDAKKTKQVNPYIWKWSWKVLGTNRWCAFILGYGIWLCIPVFESF